MATHIIHDKRYPNSQWAERRQDFLLVSAFGLWAVVLGFSPVMAAHLLLS